MASKIKKEEGKWIKFPKNEKIQLLIKPFTVLYLSKLPTEDKVTPEMLWEVFDNSVLDWKDIPWDDGTPIKYNAVNKRKVAEQDMELLLFGFNEAFKEGSIDEETVKNLKKSANGEDPKVE